MKLKFPGKIIGFCLFTIVITSAWLYRDSFSAYFFQDDWFTLNISSAKNLSDVLKFFIPRIDVIYYRPLGMHLPFFLLKIIFGINPLPFHLLTFTTHILNIILVFLLIRILIKKEAIALLSSFFYATSTAHYIPFFWSSTYPFVLGPTMFFLSFFLFLKFINTKKEILIALSFLFFFLGFFINEIVLFLPLVLVTYMIIFQKTKLFKYLIPYFSLSIIFFVVRFFWFPAPFSSDYKLVISKSILNNLQAYFLWSFNWPEEMKAQMIRFFMFNPKFIQEFKPYFVIFITTLFINLLFFFVIPIVRMKQRILKKDTYRLILLGLIWFLIGLIPVLFFPYHLFSYYLPISLAGLLLTIAVLLNSTKYSIILILILIINWFLVSATTINFNSQIHWAPRRAKLSKILIEKTIKKYPTVSDGQIIFIRPTSENKLALNDQDGFQVFYDKKTILTVYSYVIDQESL